MKTSSHFPTFILILFASFIIFKGYAQWELQYPIPTDKSLEDVCFVDELNGWIVGAMGEIWYTNDGGDSWELQESGTALRLRSVFFIDMYTGWIVGGETHPIPGDYIILHTTDGGENWAVQASDPTACLRSVFFIDSQTGWAVGDDGTLLHTANAGIDWVSQWYGSPYTDFREVQFTDPGHGWVVGDYGLYSTTNGGMDWIEKVQGGFESVYFINENEGWASTWGIGYGSAYLFHTTDAFTTWDTIKASGNYDSSSGFYSIYFKDSFIGWTLHNHCSWGGWVGGCSYNLYKTMDGGETWEDVDPLYPPVLSSPNALSFTQEGKGCIVGSHGIIFTTSNWEDAWAMKSEGNTHHFYSVDFPDLMNGWVVGAQFGNMWWGGNGSSILHTSDGGSTWEYQPAIIYGALQSVDFVDHEYGWAVGYSNDANNSNDTAFIIHTTNGGTNWNVQRYETGFLLLDVYFINNSCGWSVGGNCDGYGNCEGRILRTMDGGATWEYLNFYPSDILNAVVFADEDHGWVIGESIYHTHDGGLFWQEQVIDTNGFSLVSVCFTDASNGWIVGNKYGGSGIILHTVDGGLNWSYQINDKYYYAVDFMDSENGLISGAGGLILVTNDGGMTWEEQQTDTENTLYDVCYIDGGHGYAAGTWGAIIHSDDLVVSVNDLSNIRHNAELHCYPNPFPETTTLFLTLPEASFVSIKIYTSDGRLVLRKDESKKAGQHKMVVQGSDLPAGCYFCTLQTSVSNQTIKMIKL